jgi:hypothetical protein
VDKRHATQYEAELIAAGDRLRDDLSVLIDTEEVEGKADMLGLDVNDHMAQWEAISGQWDVSAW